MVEFRVETVRPQRAAVMEAEVPMTELRSVFDRGFHAVMQAVATQGLQVIGPPFGFYPRMPRDTVAVVVGFPVSGDLTAEGDVVPFELPGGRVVVATHVGSYEALAETYEELMTWAESENLDLAECMWESYLSDPGAEPDPSTWRTDICWPLA